METTEETISESAAIQRVPNHTTINPTAKT
jgi:hypothetical protein